MKTFNEIKNELTIKQIKENIFYLNQLIKNVENPVIKFEIRKQIKYELNLLRTRINKHEQMYFFILLLWTSKIRMLPK